MADVFISYASEDRDRVRPLAEALIGRGFSVWWDRALAAGQDYAATIERELKAAKAVVVVWTQSSAASTFVRDEAGRARDEGRLVPLLLDRVDIPLGFGAFQAEDFTRWNGGANAAQMQLLEEVLKAKLQGRDIDASAIERRRRRLGARIRVVSLLTVIALVIGIAVGGKYLFAPPPPQTDLRAELLRLLAEGQLTPQQAIQLAEILEAGALGEPQSVAMNEPSQPSTGAPAPPARSDAPMQGAGRGGEEVAAEAPAVSEAEFAETARDSYRTAFGALSQHGDAQVRLAVAQLAQPGARDAAIQTLWTYAEAHPEDPLRDEIYVLCGTVGEANNNPLGVRALEAATAYDARNTGVWRMLARSYDRYNRDAEAQAAAQVAEAVEARNQGRAQDAERGLQAALPVLNAPELRAPVASELGQIAESRGDYNAASARFSQAYASREEVARRAPEAVSGEVIEADAQQLVRALDRSGRTREACEALRRAQEAHDVAAPDQDLLDRCQRLRVPLRTRVGVSPELRRRTTPAPVQESAPSP